MNLNRRHLVLGTAASSLLAACAMNPPSSQTASTPAAAPAAPPIPIVFVHGNGDTAALWITTIWRFESNGWPRERLHAVDFPYPLARDDDTKPQPGRSSTSESMAYLAAEVDQVLAATGAAKVVLIGNSRGGNAIRNYIANGGGAQKVSHAILGGTPNHGVWAEPDRMPGNEFNGAGRFLSSLNAPKGPTGDEVTPGVLWLTIRSDNNDKYAQPDGVWIGRKGMPTNVSFDGPALKGAVNAVIPGIDHRETAFGPKAFEQAFSFITGKPPVSVGITPQAEVTLSGKVSGYGVNNQEGSAASNLPLVGAVVEVYSTDSDTGERRPAAMLRQTIGEDGLWGPLTLSSAATLEFAITAPGYATTHIYRSPFPRSSNLVHLRAERITEADKDAAAIVTLTRPRGYFGVPRDQISLDGKSPPAGVPSGVAGVSSVKLKLAEPVIRTVIGEFNGERIVGRSWPAVPDQVVLLELTF